MSGQPVCQARRFSNHDHPALDHKAGRLGVAQCLESAQVHALRADQIEPDIEKFDNRLAHLIVRIAQARHHELTLQAIAKVGQELATQRASRVGTMALQTVAFEMGE